MTEKSDNVKITVFVPRALRDAANAKAKASDTSLSRWLRGQLREWVAEPPPPMLSGWAEERTEAEDQLEAEP